MGRVGGVARLHALLAERRDSAEHAGQVARAAGVGHLVTSKKGPLRVIIHPVSHRVVLRTSPSAQPDSVMKSGTWYRSHSARSRRCIDEGVRSHCMSFFSKRGAVVSASCTGPSLMNRLVADGPAPSSFAPKNVWLMPKPTTER